MAEFHPPGSRHGSVWVPEGRWSVAPAILGELEDLVAWWRRVLEREGAAHEGRAGPRTQWAPMPLLSGRSPHLLN